MNFSSFIRCITFICCMNSFYYTYTMDMDEMQPMLRDLEADAGNNITIPANNITIPTTEYAKLQQRRASEFRHLYGIAGFTGGTAFGVILGWNGAMFDNRAPAHLIPVNVIFCIVAVMALCCYSWVFVVNTFHDTCKKKTKKPYAYESEPKIN